MKVGNIDFQPTFPDEPMDFDLRNAGTLWWVKNTVKQFCLLLLNQETCPFVLNVVVFKEELIGQKGKFLIVRSLVNGFKVLLHPITN